VMIGCPSTQRRRTAPSGDVTGERLNAADRLLVVTLDFGIDDECRPQTQLCGADRSPGKRRRINLLFVKGRCYRSAARREKRLALKRHQHREWVGNEREEGTAVGR